jgi:cell division septation protein DedD
MTKKKPIKQIFLFVGLMLVLVLIFGGRHFGIKGISDLLNPLRSSDKTRPEVLAAGIQPMVIWKKIQKSALTQPSLLSTNLNAGAETVLEPGSESVNVSEPDSTNESSSQSIMDMAPEPAGKPETESVTETTAESVSKNEKVNSIETPISAVETENVTKKSALVSQEKVTVAAVEIESIEPQSPSSQKTVLPLNPPPPFPYALQLSSCRNLKSAQNSMNDFRKSELDVYLAKIQLGGKGGTWWRVFTGQYKTMDEALDKKKELGLSEAIVQKTPYANLIGEYSSMEELRIEQERLTALGLSSYVNETPNDTYRLLIGAYTRKAQAEKQALELKAMGLMSQSITR